MHCPFAATFKPEPLSYLHIFCLGTNILRGNMRVSKIVPFSVVILLIIILFAGAVVVPAVAQHNIMQYQYDAAHSGD